MANWLVGMLRSISLESVTDAASVDLTSMVGALAWTVISSTSVAGARTMSTDRTTVVVRRMFSWTAALNPCREAFRVYSPGGRAGKRNIPWASVIWSRMPIRFLPVSTTDTPGRGFFWSSVTLPIMAPVSRDCGKDRTAMVRSKPITKIDLTFK